MMAALSLFVAVLVLAFFAVALVPVGAATNEKSLSQTAADAAALAGAQEMGREWVEVRTAPGLLRFDPRTPRLGPGTGSAAASSYATANGSTLTSYSTDVRRGRATAQVRGNSSAYPENGAAESRATAQVGADLTRCRWTDPLPPGGEPTFERTLECGDWEATYVIANDGATFPTMTYVGTTADELLDDLEPRLVD